MAMPVVRVSDASFSELSIISTWLKTKTPSETIELIVREKMESLGLERDVNEPAGLDSGPSRPTGLSFTRVVSAKVNGKELEKANWANVLLQTIHSVSKKLGISSKELSAQLQVRTRVGQYEDDGFKYHKQLGISVQGQSAQDAWKEVDRLARKFDIPVEVEFQWHDNPKAQRPGQMGRLLSP